MKQEFPKMVYVKADGKVKSIVVQHAEALKALGEHKESPAEYGIETHPENPVIYNDGFEASMPAGKGKK